MNRRQRIAFIVGLCVFVLMGVLPPWRKEGPTNPSSCGYSFVFRVPLHSSFIMGEQYQTKIGVVLDTNRLFLQWFVVAIATGGLMLLWVKPRPDSGS